MTSVRSDKIPLAEFDIHTPTQIPLWPYLLRGPCSSGALLPPNSVGDLLDDRSQYSPTALAEERISHETREPCSLKGSFRLWWEMKMGMCKVGARGVLRLLMTNCRVSSVYILCLRH